MSSEDTGIKEATPPAPPDTAPTESSFGEGAFGIEADALDAMGDPFGTGASAGGRVEPQEQPAADGDPDAADQPADDGEQPQGEDQWQPPTREEYDALVSQQLALAQLLEEQGIAPQADDDADAADGEQAAQEPEAQAEEDFAITAEEAESMFVDGNPDALKGVLARYGQHVERRIVAQVQQAQHSTAINAAMWYMPIALAQTALYEQNPVLRNLPTVVQQALFAERAANPNADHAGLIQLASRRLGPIIQKAKTIEKQSRPGKPRTSLSPSPGSGALPTRPHGRPAAQAEPVDPTEAELARLAAREFQTY